MDYAGIIQLIIATIFYSTLVAPNIKKMGELRGEMSDMQFPLKTDSKYQEESRELGTAINKKMKQYSAIYKETQGFLWFLYGATGGAFLVQIAPILHSQFVKQPIETDSVISSVITLAIFISLIIAMKIFILKPDRIRTFEWLSSVGITLTYSHDIFKPSLEINQVASNLRESNNHTNISIASDIALYGYSIILTIENTLGTRLYHIVAGRIQKEKYFRISSSHYHDGQNRALIDVVRSLRLKPGVYKTRLLIFETVYPGKRVPTQVLGGFTVSSSTSTGSVVDIDLAVTTDSYNFRSENDRPCQIEFTDDFEGGESIRGVLSSEPFQKTFSKAKVLYCVKDENGMITKNLIDDVFGFKHLVVRRIRLGIVRRKLKKKKQTSHVELT